LAHPERLSDEDLARCAHRLSDVQPIQTVIHSDVQKAPLSTIPPIVDHSRTPNSRPIRSRHDVELDAELEVSIGPFTHESLPMRLRHPSRPDTGECSHDGETRWQEGLNPS
jgi:hypothetical protein